MTVAFAFRVRVHVAVPWQPPPDQPAKVEPEAAVAVSVSLVPELNDAEHVEPQLMPVGLLVIVPMPVPDFVTVRVNCEGCWRFAEQVAVVPPFDPAQLHDHGPLPLTDEAVPGLQRLLAGALEKVSPLELPQAPLAGDDPPLLRTGQTLYPPDLASLFT